MLDPIFAELLFVARWRKLPVQFTASSYPQLSAVGPLPAGISRRGVIPRRELLAEVAARDIEGYGKALPPSDEAFCRLLRDRIGEALPALLFGEIAWEDYTRPTLVRSAPSGWGWLAALGERRAWASQSIKDQRDAAILGLETALEALADRLGGADFFREAGATADAPPGLTSLDACAYGYLSVLFSIPCERGSWLQRLLARFPALAHFCDRADLLLGGVWPDPRSFLAGLESDARLPGTAGSRVANSRPSPSPDPEGVAAPGAPRKICRPEWWELWGWSWGGKQRPAPIKVRRVEPPTWHLAAFQVSSGLVLLGAVLRGWGPPQLYALINKLRKANP